jgi:O-antigen/teichoic acid export membrane protein
MWGWSKPWLRPDIRLFDRTLLNRLFGDGILLFLLQSSVVLMFQTDRLVIGLLRTPQEVTEYSIVSRVYLLAYGCFFLVLAPLWPAYGEAWRRKDIEWCRSKLRLSIAVGVGVVLACGVVMLVAGDRILTLLSRGAVPSVSVWLLIGMIVSFCLRSWIESHSVLLNGARVLRPQVYVLGLNAALSIMISIPATRWFGVVGCVWSFPIAAIMTSVFGYPRILRRAIDSARGVIDSPREPALTKAVPAAGPVPIDVLAQEFERTR